MKTSPISVVALLLSLIACGIAFFKQPLVTTAATQPNSSTAAAGIQISEVNVLIQEAIARREKELIRNIAPKIVEMTKNTDTYDQLKPKDEPSSIEETVAPFFKLISTVGK